MNSYFIRKNRRVVNGVPLTLMERVQLSSDPLNIRHADLLGLDANDHPQYTLTATTYELISEIAQSNAEAIEALKVQLVSGELELPMLTTAAEVTVERVIEEQNLRNAASISNIPVTDSQPAPDNVLVYEPFNNELVWRDINELVIAASVSPDDFNILDARVEYIENNYAILFSPATFSSLNVTGQLTATGSVISRGTVFGEVFVVNALNSNTNSAIVFDDGVTLFNAIFQFNTQKYWFELTERLWVDGIVCAQTGLWCGATDIATTVHDLKLVQDLTNEPSGFIDKYQVYMSADTEAGTFTIWPTGSSFQFYTEGGLHTVSSAVTVSWARPTGETGLNFFYFTTGGTLSASPVFNLEFIIQECYVSNIYWNAEQQRLVSFGDERHGCTMDNATHIYLHITEGTRYQSGLGIDVVTVDGTGNAPGDASFSVSSGILRDEDLQLFLDSCPSGQSMYHIAKSGSAGTWVVEYSPYVTVTAITGMFSGSGRALYNTLSGSDWVVAEVTNNQFGLTHVFASNGYNSASTVGNSAGTLGQILLVMGEGSYGNVAEARQAASTEIASISVEGLPFEEYVAVGTIIWQTANAYSNAVKTRIRTTDLGDEYIDFRQAELTPGTAPSNHSQLTNLASDDHLQYFNTARLTSTTHQQITANIICATTTIYSGGVDLATLITGGTGTGGTTDHGALTGLFDNDHPQYAFTSTTLELESSLTAHTADTTIHFTVASIDHGSITGLFDNDHPQYRLTATTISLSGDLAQEGATTGDVIRWNGTNWVASAVTEGGTSTGSSGPSVIISAFTGDGTWNKPSGAKKVEVYLWGGGGGGGSGAFGSTNDGGGGGGAGGTFLKLEYNADDLASSASVVVGSGGTGGAGVASPGFGNDGTRGGDSSFSGTVVLGGGQGGRGTTAAGAAGGVSHATAFLPLLGYPGAGGAGGNNAVGANGTRHLQAGGGGGGGGGHNGVGGGTRAGGIGGGIATGTTTTGGADDSPSSPSSLTLGGNGGNGGLGTTDVGQDGGPGNAGGFPGGGGGGGGATFQSSLSGSGGNGAPGYVVVITHT